ncbi:hypothetical protein GALMADRAFT_138821 [Galerina marginata CBS 339.88]|uniref:Uncharacterized protein n=1 Tax=Galerina marginata (strain CBS 339.88) TaxID=685588 RepID=A0A067T5X8_GALM3|nr:hypothetical protein GALMADRAFT_138821 [Galerina marginata CBS 339.88]
MAPGNRSKGDRSKSDRSKFLDLIAPKWRVPRCPNRNQHHATICMGVAKPEDLGRRSFFCNARNGGQAQCAYHKDETWSPALDKETRDLLDNALKVFTKALADDPIKDFNRAARLGMKAAAAGQQIRSETGMDAVDQQNRTARDLQPELDVSVQSSKISIFVYLTDNDDYIEHKGTVRHGMYSFLSDSTLCDLIDFPKSAWSIYDRFLEEFIPIPTYSGVATLQDEFLILRQSSFVNSNCKGLDILIDRLNSLNLKGIKRETTKAGGKRKAFEADDGQPGPSQPRKVKRRLTVQEPEVLDWTNLS